MGSGGYHFWLGASADADPATHEPSRVTPSRPCGECPLRGAIANAKNEILSIGLEVIEQHLDRAFDILDCIPAHHP